MIETLTIVGGLDKYGCAEAFGRFECQRGRVYAIVGPTGSGKTQLLEDIESLSEGESVSKRHVLLNGDVPHHHYFQGARSQWIALLSQSMKFVLDVYV